MMRLTRSKRAMARLATWPFWRAFIWPGKPEPTKSRKIARGRLRFMTFPAIFCFITIAAQAMNLSVFTDDTRARSTALNTTIERGAILDRRGRLLASTVPVMSLYADPTKLLDPSSTAKQLAPHLPDKTKDQIYQLLLRDTHYVELDWKITPKRHAKIMQLGLPGIYIAPATTRLYPQGREAAHIVGAVDRDGRGIAGIELSQNAKLAAGEPVTLSIDLGIQAIIRRALSQQITAFEAIGGVGLMLDMKNGELISMVSLPDFDPNHMMASTDTARFHQAAKGVFEMGSIFKVLNTAIALETGAVKPEDRIDVRKPIRIGRFTITDYHPQKRDLNISEILVHSSNIGAAHMAQLVGPETQKAYMDRLGLLDVAKLEIPENARPLTPANWKRLASITIAYGHGLSVSPVQAAAAIAAAAGSGDYIAPTLLKRGQGLNQASDAVPKRVRIFSKKTTKAVRSMMRLVVSHESGTGNFADAPGYMVGGKTGTAEKIINKGYNKKSNRVFFVGVFPAHDPAYLIFVMVDEPKGQSHSYGYATAGWVAAPAIKSIVEQIAPLLGIAPVMEPTPEIRRAFLPAVMIDGKEAIHAAF